MSKRLDFQHLADIHKFTIAHAELYVDGLLNALTQRDSGGPLLIVIPGTPQELQCQDGTVVLRSFVLLETPEFRDWHQQALKDIGQKLTYNASTAATAAELAGYTDAQFLLIAQQAMKALNAPPKAPRPRPTPADAADPDAPKPPKASSKSKKKPDAPEDAPAAPEHQGQDAQGTAADEAQKELVSA